ncbi:MAG: DUF835 domain-containing protein [Methanobacteriota archaeon]|nr:MAG: DUF835 domain-containing protein [Euryarchaeota archaeon]
MSRSARFRRWPTGVARRWSTPVLWLTESTGLNHVLPTHLDMVEELVARFAGSTDAPVVAFEGAEYLANYHDFDRVLRTLRRIRDTVTARGGVLLLSADTSLLDEREFSLLEKEFEPFPMPPGVESVEDVFLIHESGILISHSARRLKPETDRDTMAGMLTAIMNFARVSFTEGKGELRRLGLGEKTVTLERGRHLILAVVFAGETGTLSSPGAAAWRRCRNCAT